MAWSKRIVPDVARWLERPSDAVMTYHMVQALTGHGSFQAFLYARKRVMDPGCPYCPEVWDDIEHTLFVCPHFGATKEEIVGVMERHPVPEDMGTIMTEGHRPTMVNNVTLREIIRRVEASTRRLLTKMVSDILTEKEAAERAKKAKGSQDGGWQEYKGETAADEPMTGD